MRALRSRVARALAVGLIGRAGIAACAGIVSLGSCGDSGGGGGVTSSSEHVEGTLPLTTTQCFTQPLLDVLPQTAGDQFDCTATLDGEVLPACGSSEPCWEIVAATDVTCTNAPAVRGGNDGQTFAIDCIVEE